MHLWADVNKVKSQFFISNVTKVLYCNSVSRTISTIMFDYVQQESCKKKNQNGIPQLILKNTLIRTSNFLEDITRDVVALPANTP